MKNKGFFKTAAALLAALVLLGGFSVTAYAGGGEDIPTNDSGVIVETEPQPLTPDGNLSLIAAEDKQFIIVQSKNGYYFYIIVDRAAEGENTVHFLNQVDEADLMALMEGDSGKAQAPAVCTCKDKCKAGAVNTACPVCSVNMTECAGKEAVPEPDHAPPEKQKSNAGGLVIFHVVTLLAGGGVGVAGVDDDGAGLALFQDLAVKDDRSCAELVRGEAGRAGAGQVGVENSDVGLLVLALFDGGVDRAGGEALRRGNAALDLFQIGHVGGSPLLTLV